MIVSSLFILSTQDTLQDMFVIWVFLASKYLLYMSHLTMYGVSTLFRLVTQVKVQYSLV